MLEYTKYFFLTRYFHEISWRYIDMHLYEASLLSLILSIPLAYLVKLYTYLVKAKPPFFTVSLRQATRQKFLPNYAVY